MNNGHLIPLQVWDGSEEFDSDQENELMTSVEQTPKTSRSIVKSIRTYLNVSGNGGKQSKKQKKISDAVVYGPRFDLLFDSYCAKFDLQIDINEHLMVLCLQHLVTFCSWVRKNDDQITWVSNTLFDYDYLRPEVRNGIVMIIVYTFAAFKARKDPHRMDMFTVLQDTKKGMGLANNKLSLKVFKDPFHFLTFLKTSISGLIDAGYIPDNERQNHPKPVNTQNVNKEELSAYQEVARLMRDCLSSDNIKGAREMAQNITTHWQREGKVWFIYLFIMLLMLIFFFFFSL